MSRRLLVDTGVIWSFAVADALPLLLRVSDGGIDAVEIVRSELLHGSVDDADVRLKHAANSSGITWISLETELQTVGVALNAQVEQVRAAFVQPGDSNLKHLGESHMFVLAQRLPERWTVCFEDRDARRFAEDRALPLRTTIELLRAGFDQGEKCAEIVRVYEAMLTNGRRLPKGLTRDDLCAS